MEPDRWQRVTAIFEQALEREGDARLAFVRDACSGDAELQREVEVLLRSHDEAGSFLSASPASPSGPATAKTPALTSGTRLGPYEVTEKIGEGGMGEVYRARDTKLDRDVALKVLPSAFTDDPERLARFEREAKVLASLNHPNIAGIHGLEEADGVRGLALELVEGPTLADRIARGPIPVDEALPIAKQIAEALEAAHEQGIIHRDLKPANIKLRSDGTVKVLDFGLAKALDAAGAAGTADPNQSPTLTAAATQRGLIMGTAAYMSPEQAGGRPVDRRSDIWSFGVVLYEMLTGSRLFDGDSVTQVLARVLERGIDLGALPATVPPGLMRLLRRCLDRDSTRRLRDIGEARIGIDEALAGPEDEGDDIVVKAPNGRAWLPWTLAGLLAVAVVGLWWSGSETGNLRPRRFTITPPAGTLLGVPRLSPDGRTAAFTLFDDDGFHVYVRPLDALDAESVLGPERAYTDGFSPDSQWLMYKPSGAPRGLYRIPVSGGLASQIAAGPFETAAWGPGDQLVLGSEVGLWLVPEFGAERVRLTTTADGELQHTFPHFLPDGTAVLYEVWTGNRDTAQVAVYDLDTGVSRYLLPGMAPQYATSGHLVFWREGRLWAVAFDRGSLSADGSPVPVVDGVLANFDGLGHYAVGADGTLLYTPVPVSGRQRSLVWVDREGREQDVALEPSLFGPIRLSPNGDAVAMEIRGSDLPVPLIPTGGNTDIWIYEFEAELLTRFTFDAAEDRMPIWSPDGRDLVFSSGRAGGALTLVTKPADGTGEVARVTSYERIERPLDVTPDGGVLYTRSAPDGQRLQATAVPGETESQMTLFNVRGAALSPDGRWLAYVSRESGRSEVYVRPYPSIGGAQWLVSDGVGLGPVWGPDGAELFYQTPLADGTSAVMAVSVSASPAFSSGTPRILFTGPYRVGDLTDYRAFDTADGQRFLLIKENPGPLFEPTPVVVVENWFTELERLVPTN